MLLFTACATTPTPTAPAPPFAVEQALARAILPYNQLSRAVCEWELLGAGEDAVYVWAVCMGHYRVAGVGETAASLPARLDVDAQGHVKHVTLPCDGIDYLPSLERMFPPEVVELALHFDAAAPAARAQRRLITPALTLQSTWPWP